MGIIELILTSIGLGMDAFAVSVCKGLSMKKMSLKKAVIIAFYFGGFQALMPIIGYYLANIFKNKVESISNIIAFVLLFFIGVKMIKEAFIRLRMWFEEHVAAYFVGLLPSFFVKVYSK